MVYLLIFANTCFNFENAGIQNPSIKNILNMKIK